MPTGRRGMVQEKEGTPIKGVLLGQLPQEANETQCCWETQGIAETESFSSQWLKESG